MAERSDLDRSAPQARPYIPHGVNAASWMGFEQRIQERRFRALLDAINTAIVAGDVTSARVALDEARELRPGAPEITDLETRLDVLAAMPAVVADAGESHLWWRAFGAVALLVVGISLLVGLEWLRPSEPIAPVPVATPNVQVVTPARDMRLALTPAAQEPAVTSADEQPVATMEAEPAATPVEPRGTTGEEARPPSSEAARSITRAVNVVERRAPVAHAGTTTPTGEIPDDYVVTPVAAATPVTINDTQPVHQALATPPPSRPAPTPPASRAAASDVAPAVTNPSPAAPIDVPTMAVATNAATGRLDQSKVEEVLQRYARAYGQLDASAAREVWPTVDAKALARAFQGLSSQDVSFDACDIEIRGPVANASCRGQASYVGKVGSREPHTEARLWRFELRRDGDAWKIENAEARRQGISNYREK